MPVFSFGQKKEGMRTQQQPVVAGGSGLPVEQVRMMKQQGLSDSQIIQTLQRDGFKSHQIFDAMNQAELVSGGPVMQQEQTAYQPGPPVMQESEQYQDPYGGTPQYEPYQQQQPSQNMQGMAQMDSQPLTTSNMDRIEEVAESIIEEKWADLMKGVNKIADWKDKTELRLAAMEARISDLRVSFDELNKNLMGKIGEYDRSMAGVGTEIKAMEKVFQQMLPTFTESVGDLSRITRDLKKKP